MRKESKEISDPLASDTSPLDGMRLIYVSNEKSLYFGGFPLHRNVSCGSMAVSSGFDINIPMDNLSTSAFVAT